MLPGKGGEVKIRINTAFFSSPLVIFFMYILISGLAIMGFRLIFPDKAIPLAFFSNPWRLIQGLLDYIDLFPALILSALVIPFGFKIHNPEKNAPYSPQFLESIKMSIITVIVASAIYGLMFSLVFPIAKNYETDLLFRSRLYQLAKERAQECAARSEWEDTLQFLAICESIWPNSPEITKLKTDAEVYSEVERLTPEVLPDNPAPSSSQGRFEPVDVTEALAMAQTALAEERYFDAHWLATLGSRLASPGSAEVALATRLAGLAWNGVNSLAPNARETRQHNIYRLKRDGYEALLGGEWIRAYYIFHELLSLDPNDLDAMRYFSVSEDELKQAAFFLDEIELTLGQILTGAVFSFPLGHGRLVMRISSLSTSTDSAYGIGSEILAFDRDGRPLWSMEAPYAKFLPLSLDSGPSLSVKLRALDRNDKTRRWEVEAKSLGQIAPEGTELVLPVSWDNFLLLSAVRRGLSGLSPVILKRAADNLGAFGYLPQVFEAELLECFVRPLFILPFGVFTLVLGLRFRALKRPRYMGIPMLGILPVVFNGAVQFIRNWLNDLGIWTVLSLGFRTAALFFAIGIVVLFFISLIVLASQHE